MNLQPRPAESAAARDAAPGELERRELLPDVVRSIYGQASPALAAYMLGGVLLFTTFFYVAPHTQLYAWSGVFMLVWLGRWALVRWYARTPHADRNRQAQSWLTRWCAGALAAAAVWGLAAWLFYGYGRIAHHATVMLLIYSYCVGVIQLLAWTYRVFIGFLSLCFVPLIARVLISNDQDVVVLTVLLVVSYFMALAQAWNYRRVFERAIALKVRNERLASQLKVEKEIADEARQAAETANRAKTQFFAAASHDLRQPLHAMGLFAEALRAKLSAPQAVASTGTGPVNAEVLHLVGSIDASVDALEGLFGELLDITKIDTGGVEPRPVDFSLRELFQRMALQYEPTAFEKGLALRFRGGHRHVHGDPVLVDRIVRNLLSNAIRYTRDGGILIGARPRGDRVLIQVWDTGVGIPKTEQARVFDEFYQVHAGAPLEAHQPKGLGLGLAIVHRLARLTGAPLSLASEPGRGTVFTLSLPRGKPPPPSFAPAPITARPALGLTLDRRSIVVVEDEAAVLEGLTLLLKSWGAEVHSFEAVSQLEAWLRVPGIRRPDLAIVDYRLPEGRTGLDALAVLRAPFAGPPLPAIIVTGSTIGGHEDEAATHDFHLLIKPVAPTKLRAMIAFKLGLK